MTHGQKGSIGGTALRLVAATTPVAVAVLIKALADNSGTVYVGGSTVTTANGFPLAAGEETEVVRDEIPDATDIYVIGSAAGQAVAYRVV
jgi:hypothetical protein